MLLGKIVLHVTVIRNHTLSWREKVMLCRRYTKNRIKNTNMNGMLLELLICSALLHFVLVRRQGV